MERSVLSLMCFTGVLQVALTVLYNVPHVYHLILIPKTWTSAQMYCRKNFVDLATVITADDWKNFYKEQRSHRFSSYAWVGLYNDINSWRWSYNNAPLQLKKWSLNEPINESGNDSCGALDSYGYWWDLNCLTLKPFLCYDASYKSRFISITTWKTWLDAQAYCRQYHTDLATSDNETDNSLLKGLVEGQWSAWFGLFRDTWKWSDQSNASNINWLPGLPDNLAGNENCGTFTIAYFDDAPCFNLLPFICHTIPPVREKQTVSLYVMSEQNMTDPSKEMSILHVIQQVLKDHGMAENSTLTWRLQPDGNIFHRMKEERMESMNNSAGV